MTTMTIPAPLCPQWCEDHEDLGEGAFNHVSTLRVVESFADADSSKRPDVSVSITLYERWDAVARTIHREGPHIYVRAAEDRTFGLNLTVADADSARRLGLALIAAAQAVEAQARG